MSRALQGAVDHLERVNDELDALGFFLGVAFLAVFELGLVGLLYVLHLIVQALT